ncbi:MAG: hypothetical protein K9G65_05855 [Rickettsiaceae bacterium]|nr:hypothetical protein [Rickettsiaceae bacterium]
MSKENLKKLLGYLLEADTEIFGKSFNDPDKKRPMSNPPEKNTPEEQKFVNKLDKWFNSHLVAGSLNKFADDLAQLMPIIKSDKYPELNPPSGDVYRGMKLTVDQLKSFMGLKDFEIKAGEYKTINQGGVLTPQKIKYYTAGKPISSWSTSAKAAAAFTRTTSADEKRNVKLSVVFVANTSNPSNDFILNPDKLLSSYSRNITQYDYEKEVISIGPVSFDRVIVYSDIDVLPPPTFKDEVINTAINTITNEVTIALKDPKSNIYVGADYLGLIQRKNTKGASDPTKSDRREVMWNLCEAIVNILARHLNENIIKKPELLAGGLVHPWIYNVLNVISEDYNNGITTFANSKNIKLFLSKVIRKIISPSKRPGGMETSEMEKLATAKQKQT